MSWASLLARFWNESSWTHCSSEPKRVCPWQLKCERNRVLGACDMPSRRHARPKPTASSCLVGSNVLQAIHRSIGAYVTELCSALLSGPKLWQQRIKAWFVNHSRPSTYACLFDLDVIQFTQIFYVLRFVLSRASIVCTCFSNARNLSKYHLIPSSYRAYGSWPARHDRQAEINHKG